MFPRTIVLLQLLFLAVIASDNLNLSHGATHQILVDSDINIDDYFALLYLLKLDQSEFNLKAITINTNTWTNAGHAVNHLYDILYMMGRDDIPVGIGGNGGILCNGTVLPNVGGYFPLIEQESSTVGGCRYRQAIPPGAGGLLDVDTAYGVRKGFLPQGERRYAPLKQPTAQEVMIDALSSGPTVVILLGAHTNFALLLRTHPHLRKNVEHIYVMGGGVNSFNPTGCCPANESSCTPTECGNHGNLYTVYHSNPFAEFNIFGDPFAAYEVFHSGLPITLVPLDATNTIVISREFFSAFQENQKTYEAKYVFESLKMVRDTWFDNNFYTNYYMWDSFTLGIVVSSIHNGHHNTDANEFAELKYMNVTVVTSNKPYDVQDGSNPFFDNRKVPKFHLKKGGVHSGHVQESPQDPFCYVENGKGKCQDGYTKEENSSEGVKILVATKAKPNPDTESKLDRAFYINFLDVLNSQHQTAKFNLKTEFPYYKEVIYNKNSGEKRPGKPVIFDMDMSPGDIMTLFYLLKIPTQSIDLKAVTINANGWTNGATIDVIYDILHMMGRDDIPVGLGDFFALNQTYSSFGSIGDCKYSKVIPKGSGGLIDTDTLLGLARDLPHSPRRYTAHNSVKFGAVRDTEHPELRQPLAKEVWKNITSDLKSGSKVTILATGPLTNVANFISSSERSKIKEVYIVGGHLGKGKGNLFTMPSNKKAEFNFFLDPLAAKQVISSGVNITLVPLDVQRSVSSLANFKAALEQHKSKKMTPEAAFVHCLSTMMLHLSTKHHLYKHLSMFMGEVVGGVILADEEVMEPDFGWIKVKVMASGDVKTDGWTTNDKLNQKARKIRVVKQVDSEEYYKHVAKWLNTHNKQSAVIANFAAQKKLWNNPQVALVS